MKTEIKYNPSDLVNHYGIWLWVENDKRQIFMQYHNKFDCWTIPLEKSDPGENLDDAIIRSGKEELDIDIQEYEIVHSQRNQYTRDGQLVKVKGNLVKVTQYTGEPRNVEVEKHSDAGWKDKEFIKGLTDATTAVETLQKYI